MVASIVLSYEIDDRGRDMSGIGGAESAFNTSRGGFLYGNRYQSEEPQSSTDLGAIPIGDDLVLYYCIRRFVRYSTAQPSEAIGLAMAWIQVKLSPRQSGITSCIHHAAFSLENVTNIGPWQFPFRNYYMCVMLTRYRISDLGSGEIQCDGYCLEAGLNQSLEDEGEKEDVGVGEAGSLIRYSQIQSPISSSACEGMAR
ncbi:hypothetical protein E4U19_007626 [Claviceps sp. Clav32 group G5]|nr:hypothetical protein E4U19_007626 [Claviceps sp. Clav32 group G5]